MTTAIMVSGELPEPIHSVVTAPEVITAITLVVVGVLTWISMKIKRSTDSLKEVADATHEQVANTHQTNLRDDLDSIRDQMMGELARIRAEQKADSEARERRDRRAEDQIDGLRDDVRGLTERAEHDHQVIHKRIDDIKTRI